MESVMAGSSLMNANQKTYVEYQKNIKGIRSEHAREKDQLKEVWINSI